MLKKFFTEIRALIILVIVAFTVKTTLVEIYVVPTGSMENTILTGDMLIGNKFIYGMRTPTWIGLPWSRIGFNIPWFRLPQFKKIDNGDVTIFEFPRDPFQKYVKRCIGIPKDSINIKAGIVMVNSDTMLFPEFGKYIKGYTYDPEKIEKLYPYFRGNRDNIEPFVVPYKNMVIDFNNIMDWETIITLLVQDGNEVKLGKNIFTMIDPHEISRTHGFLKNKILRLISSERKALMREKKERVDYINKLNKKYKEEKLINPWYINYSPENSEYLLDNITLNGVTLKNMKKYNIKKDYYFFMGDNRDSSYDSRFWGFVPHDQVLGTPLISLINIFKFKLRLKAVS